jgi:uncharacterized protein (DUF2062 family)
MISANIFYKTNAGMIATLLCGFLSFRFNAMSDPILLGRIICGVLTISFAGSLPFFYLAGRSYEKFVIKKAKKKARNAEKLELGLA